MYPYNLKVYWKSLIVNRAVDRYGEPFRNNQTEFFLSLDILY
ncbi:protein of unknown function [Cardinium endosymbiont cEper1 of Encarsia pergandiella]|nr:protein of unknown function [Cardinium endosymbiont cEper1 of Encarsia pergandiella]